jgi:hypothetical protein
VPLSPNYDEDDHDHDVKYDEFSTPSMSWDCFDCTVNIMMNWIGILILTPFHKIYYSLDCLMVFDSVQSHVTF